MRRMIGGRRWGDGGVDVDDDDVNDCEYME
jgi:hypothetical protein